MTAELVELALKLNKRAKEFETQTTEFNEATEEMSEEIRNYNMHQQAWGNFYNNVRTFQNLMAWEHWTDMHGGGVFSYRLDGHSIQWGLSEKLINKNLEKFNVLREIDWDSIGLKLEEITKQEAELSNHFLQDSMTMTFEGRVSKNGVSINFIYQLQLWIFPRNHLGKLKIVKRPSLILGENNLFERSDIQIKVNDLVESQINDDLLGDLFDDIPGELFLSSAHFNQNLSIYAQFDIPKKVKTYVAGSALRNPPPTDWEDLTLMINDDVFPIKVNSQVNHPIGWLWPKADPFNPGEVIIPFTYRVDISTGGSINFGFWRFRWSYQATHWPQFWIRVQSRLENGTAVVYSTVSRANSNTPEKEEILFKIPGVARIESSAQAQKGYFFKLAYA